MRAQAFLARKAAQHLLYAGRLGVPWFTIAP
jgi:hypothetical protein